MNHLPALISLSITLSEARVIKGEFIMKKIYEAPTLEIASVTEEDIICISMPELISVGSLGHRILDFNELGVE